MHRRRVLTAAMAALAGLVLTGVTAGPAAADDATGIADTKPTWLSYATHLGAAADSSAMSARVYLAPRGGARALEAAATAASTPGTSTYHRFISPATYVARYSPTTRTVHTVESYLKKAGLHIAGVSRDRDYIAVSGDVAAAEKAFSAPIARYKHGSQTVQAPTTTLQVPRDIAPFVLTVTGLDTSVVKMKPLSSKADVQPAGFRNGRPCSAYYGQLAAAAKADGSPLPKFQGRTLPYAVCGYTGPQFRSVYEGSTSLTGAGVSIGILGAYADPTIAADADTYATRHGDGAFRPGQLVQTLPASFTVDEENCGDPTDYYGEETLDIEASHAMARGARLHYYGVVSCEDTDFEDTYRTILDQNSVQIVSTSYGDTGEDVPATEIVVESLLFARGALQGISFVNSSGDDGDEAAVLGAPEPDFPATDPFVTAVGGTATGIGAGGRLKVQTGWGTEKYTLSDDASSWTPVGFLYGSGGGTSAVFPKPRYQAGVVPGTARQEPDVAMDADPTTGMLVGETQEFPDGTYYDEYRIGGTSLSSPLFAGMTALALQKSGHRAGLLNPVIYRTRATAFTDVAGTPADPGNVRADYVNGVDASDGLTYSVRTFDQDSSLTVTKGWDNVTGVGVPNPGWLIALR